MQHYKEYIWKEGVPYGVSACDLNVDRSYAIVADPYRKRISIEEYRVGRFERIVYDSALFDFRHLKTEQQTAWEKKVVKEDVDQTECEIRDQNGRLILIEHYTFKGDQCRECRTYSPFHILLSLQKMSYECFGDLFNGVTMYDSNEHLVMLKKYSISEESGQFLELIESKT